MRSLLFIALLASLPASAAFGCSIDQLKVIAEDHLERFPSGSEREFAVARGEYFEGGGGSWQVFERESGVPHSIVIEMRNQLGKNKLRISFLNRKDFVITEVSILYADRVMEKDDRTGKYIIGSPSTYYFCDGQQQMPADEADGKTASNGNYWKDWLEKAHDFKPDLQRIPQK